ncbi:hypothetical protein ABE073_04240 [Lederbergia citrisecunda]|uniref:hypothetical protein n=1 Tax=Lederbergia citrisecunda TaxID=2833583 RepID=UPI003D2DD70D
MNIHEVFEYAQDNEDGEVKFKPKNLSSEFKDVTFEVLDAHFGFAVYEGGEGFVSKHQFRQIYGDSMKYEIV